jgi:fumarate hydratase subunit alpha
LREIESKTIADTVCKLCIEANYFLNEDVKLALESALEAETSELARKVLRSILENASAAKESKMPICQDTGMAVVFAEIGQDVHVVGENFADAVNSGVRRGYSEGYLRKSVVSDPLNRENTGNNTPAILHTEIVSGDKIKITVAPKGFGSENYSKIKMLKPADGVTGVKDFVIEVVKSAGASPCPPIIVGVGIGGTFEKAAILSKKALIRDIRVRNSDKFYAALEKDLLREINESGIGPQGFGGKTTALAVNIETFPTHIAGLPVAVNISCHVTRHRTAVI